MLAAMLREAWRAMGANRLRALLTMLGMVIGVGAVVLMLAVGRGAQYMVNQTIATMGSNLFIVLAGYATQSGVRSATGASPRLTTGDALAIAELPSVTAVGPVLPESSQLVYGPNNWNAPVIGATPSYFEVRDWRLASGAPFTDADLRSATRVAVLGQTVVDNLFGNEDPLGKTIRIRNSPYLVVGTLQRKGQSLDGRDQDDSVIVPLTTAQRKLFGGSFPDTVRFIFVQARSAEEMPRAEKAMTDLLRQRHRLHENVENDFTIRNLSSVAEAEAATTRIMSFMLGAIASVSLLVGGIGIMNIMLVSVTERTREIGIRAAVGARRRDILAQFLLEALIISIIGCLIGVALGIGAAALVSVIAGSTVVVTGVSILEAFAVAAAVGVFFGFYPARKAAWLDPVDALRYQ